MGGNMALKAARAFKGVSQTDMARATGMSLTSYNSKENGKGSFSVKEVRQIASKLQLTPKEVMSIFFTY